MNPYRAFRLRRLHHRSQRARAAWLSADQPGSGSKREAMMDAFRIEAAYRYRRALKRLADH